MKKEEIRILKDKTISEAVEKIKEELTIRDIADEVISGMQENKRNNHLENGIYSAHLKIKKIENAINENRADIRKLLQLLVSRNILTEKDLKPLKN